MTGSQLGKFGEEIEKFCIYRKCNKYVTHTGWCLLSRNTVIPHMVHQGDALVYYLHVILLIQNILTRTTEVMEGEKTRENG